MYTDNHERLPEAPEAVKNRRVVLEVAWSRIVKAVPYVDAPKIPEVIIDAPIVAEQEPEISNLDKIRMQIEQAINEEPQDVSEAA